MSSQNKPDSHAAGTEFAYMAGRNANPYYDLHRRTGVSLRHVVELARENRLGELFTSDGRLIGNIPQHPGELRRAVEALRIPPSQTGPGGRSLIPGRLAHQIAQAARLRLPAAYADASPCAPTQYAKPKRIVSVIRDGSGKLVPLRTEDC